MSVEELGGGASVGNSDTSGGNNVSQCTIEIDPNEEFSKEEFSKEEMKQFNDFKNASKVDSITGQRVDAKPKIQKVPHMLRDNNNFKKYFEPKVFSFGPYKRPLCTHKMAEQIKVNLAAKFLQQNFVEIEDLYRGIKKKIKELKECYNDDLTNDYKDKDHKLAWLFLVDGCAILQFMFISINFQANPEMQLRNLGIKTDYALFLAQDLFLLENQLPFKLLQLIIRRAKRMGPLTKADELYGTSKADELLESIHKFIFYRFRTIDEWHQNRMEILKYLKDDHVHLLDLLRKKLIQPLNTINEKPPLIEVIISRTVDLFDKLKCNKNEFDRDWVPLRNIGMLREAGINLKLSKTSCLGDISFSGGTLKLPSIIVEESSTSMFLNMLGYEMCPDFHNGSEVSSYMHFMDKLIDRTQDVEELREKNILQNELGSDEEVVKLFNQISTHLFLDCEGYYYVKSDIDDFFDNKGLMWLHKVCHDIHQYFKRRWSLLAFIGALLAIASTIIQTVITVFAYQVDSKIGK